MRPEPSARRVRPVLLLVLLVGLSVLAGCLGAADPPYRVVPYLPLNDAEPGRATEFAFFVETSAAFRTTLPVGVRGLPEGWSAQPEAAELDLPGRASTSLIVRIVPHENATYGPHGFAVTVGDAAADVIVNVRDLSDERLRAGVGASLYYVGWYANGTLFGYNEPSIRSIPFAPPGEDAENATIDFTPLKVYVGGRRGEDPPEPYNGTGYRPVIAGFDARLRDAGDGAGMVAGDTLAVRIPKEKAYTTAGNEDHVLYGEDLNFLIRIVSVDVLVARECDLPVCP